MKYGDAVKEARSLVRRSDADQWRLAQLTWEQVQAGKSRKDWAQDIGVGATYAANLFQIWAEYHGVQPAKRPGFAAAYDKVTGRAEAVVEHGSQYAAEAVTAFRNMAPEKKATLVREAIKEEPKVARAVAKDLDARYAVTSQPAPARSESTDGGRGRDDVIDRLVREVQRNDAALAYYTTRQSLQRLREFSPTDIARQVARDQSSPSGVEMCRLEAEEGAAFLREVADALAGMQRGKLEVIRRKANA